MGNSSTSFLWILRFLACIVSFQSSSTLNAPHFTKHGGHVVLTWQLPENILDTVFMVSFRHPQNLVFIASANESSNNVMIMPAYLKRAVVRLKVDKRVVEFALLHITSRDAGRYFCLSGITNADVIGNCGQTLVVIGAPVNAVVIQDRNLVTGSDVQLRCSANSSTTPSAYSQPMKIQWFEARFTANQRGETEWTKINLSIAKTSQDGHNQADNEFESGSGELLTEKISEVNSDNILEIKSLAKTDEGRMIACSASERFDLWSRRSKAFVFKPEWEPTPSDISFMPALTVLTVHLGESTQVMCSASCRPGCAVSWQKLIANDQAAAFSETSILSLVNVGHHHQGTYRCLASNQHGSTSKTLSLTVTDPPRLWFSDANNIITMVSVSTVALALGMTCVAVVVVRYRSRAKSGFWRWQKKTPDAVPLTTFNAK